VFDAELPAVPASAGALIFDRAERLLILKPTYKTGWTIPGGVMEADGETPWDACRRCVYLENGRRVPGIA
jgi:8-oxo-dGTP diphosphatase